MFCIRKLFINGCFVLTLLAAFTGCKQTVNPETYSHELDSISQKWVPDKREGICEVRLYSDNGILIIKGATTLPEAKREIIAFLESEKVKFVDSLEIFPDTNIVKKPWGLINVSVCNIRNNPGHDMELVSQALMGTPVKIFREDNGWFQIQTPDFYIGWIDGDAVVTMNRSEFLGWKSSSRIIYTGKTGDIIASPDDNTVISDIVAGMILKTSGSERGLYHVILPDGRSGWLPEKLCSDFTSWAKETRPEADRLIVFAKSLMGTPYLWGGTSVKALDCSGFVKTVYFLNGLILARDASLQVRHGEIVQDHRKIENLQKGDLLFFGWDKNTELKPSHVGMYIGNTEFIHESGMVKINSLDSTRSNFSRFRRDSFLAARRLIGIAPGAGMQAVANHPWYF